jgi:hypothetical protein
MCLPATALAQDEGLSLSVGARAWFTQWTSFSYYAPPGGANLALTQESASEKLVLIPVLSVRYGDFLASVSYFPTTGVDFSNGDSGTRREIDLNLGYNVIPGVTLTLGYKKISQRSDKYRYEPAGPMAGVSASAPLAGAYSIYGSLALGKLKTPQSGGEEVVKFNTDYRLTEVGLAYTLSGQSWPKRWIFTGGYRIQILSSKDAFNGQDGRDTTQGFTLGALATF